MDPNATLQRIRQALVAYDAALGEAPRTVALSPLADAASEARDAFRDLDEWVRRGGFLPHDWAAYGVDDQG